MLAYNRGLSQKELAQIKTLTNQLKMQNIEEIITEVRTIQARASFEAGKEAGYRDGFDIATRIS